MSAPTTSGPAAAAALVLAALAGATWLGSETLARSWLVAGESMTPALEPGDRVVVDLWTLRRRAPRVGEVVLFDEPGSRMPLVKRVAAPARDGRVWVLGDNRAGSADSREFGAVPLRALTGRVVARYWPPSRIGGIDAPSPRRDATLPRR